ncbi:MAG: type I DNA topoisomerase [Candidatus Saccharimonadales bacterium]
MAKNLVIVESPAKAKTIGRFLGSNYQIKSSLGHIRDLPKQDLGVDIKNKFMPTYQVSPGKEKTAKELKAAAKDKAVWLATDEDREGEAIAWHVCNVIGADPAKTHRIVFHEITEPAVKAAIAKPRTIDMKLVDSQQARRILDRLVGYELSPVLWKKVRTGLSAGRVQSVAVRLIVDREREIKDFKPVASFKVTAEFDAGGQPLPAELDTKLENIEESRRFLNQMPTSRFKVANIAEKPASRSPSAPFTTSTLQQEAARRLGFSVKQTMVTAQRLYENGLITYMRTDSTTLSPQAIEAAKSYIIITYGAKYSYPRQFQTKAKLAQEAHEAIRPANLSKPTAGVDSGQKKLYELIWRRAIASQMTAAQIAKTEVSIEISNQDLRFIASGEVLVFDGFIKVYGGGRDDRILPKVAGGQDLNYQKISATETYSRPPARYSEATLVKKLEQLGIGRPSTYSPIISTIQDREYVEKTDIEGQTRQVKELTLVGDQLKEQQLSVNFGADRSKLMPTPLGELVTDFLITHFKPIVDYQFTALAEEQFDQIAEGKIAWQSVLEDFYKFFHPLIEKSKDVSRFEAVKARELGTHPKTGKKIIVRYGRYGPVLQMGEATKDKKAPKPQFAPLPDGSTIEDIDLKQALPMFNLPRPVGQTDEGTPILADIGRFGPYLKVGKKSLSIEGSDPLSISEPEAKKLIAEHDKRQKERVIADWGTLKILRGPYGPFITDGKKNAPVPKSEDPEKVSEPQAKDILRNARPKRHFRRPKRLPKT